LLQRGIIGLQVGTAGWKFADLKHVRHDVRALLTGKLSGIVFGHRIENLLDELGYGLTRPDRVEIISGQGRPGPPCECCTMTGSAARTVNSLASPRLRIGVDALGHGLRLLGFHGYREKSGKRTEDQCATPSANV
jgi:hypothetical protein